MAIPSTIPTSFVPHQQFTAPVRGPQKSGRNLFMIVSVGVLVIVVIVAGGVFGYEKYLQSVRASKDAQLESEQQGIDESTVEGFVALSDRIAGANAILNSHIELSQFFDLLEQTTLQSVSITSLNLQVADDRSATLTFSGTAASFNALASESAAFAAQPLIKQPIFSGLTTNKDGSVGFSVTASVDPKLIIESQAPAAAAASAGASSDDAAAATPATPATPVPLPAAAPTASTSASESASTSASTTP